MTTYELLSQLKHPCNMSNSSTRIHHPSMAKNDRSFYRALPIFLPQVVRPLYKEREALLSAPSIHIPPPILLGNSFCTYILRTFHIRTLWCREVSFRPWMYLVCGVGFGFFCLCGHGFLVNWFVCLFGRLRVCVFVRSFVCG